MATTEAQKRASQKYAKNKLKRIPLDVQKEYYENVISVYAEKCGLSVNTFIKEAIKEKIEKINAL